MANLFPEGYEEEIVTESEIASDTPIGYLRGPAFDYTTGDFIRDGKNKVVGCTGTESWEAWCRNTLSTERYKHLGYSTDIGIELDAVFQAQSRKEAESILSRQITEALLADPYGRTEYVETIGYTWTDPDAVVVSLVICGINHVTIDITTNITRGGF